MKIKAELELLRHANRVQANEILKLRETIGPLIEGLQSVRVICRDMTKHELVKLMEIHEITGKLLGSRQTTLLDMRHKS